MSLTRGRCLTSLFLVLVGITALAQEHTISMELRRGMPFVEVMVNGKGPFTFGIDTGTGGQALVSPDLIERLGLPVTGEAEVGDPSGANSHKVSTVRIQSLKVAGLEFKDVTATQHRPSQVEGQCDGILGFVLFHDYLFTLDYPGKLLIVASGSLKPDGGDTVIPFTMPNDVPLIELSLEQQKIAAHLDSRGLGFSIPEEYRHDLKFVSDPIVIGHGRTVSNDFEIKGAQLAGDIHLGGYTFPQPFVALNPIFPVGNFGAAPLQHFAVTFDQKNLLLKLVAKEKTIVLPPPQRRTPPPTPPQASAPN